MRLGSLSAKLAYLSTAAFLTLNAGCGSTVSTDDGTTSDSSAVTISGNLSATSSGSRVSFATGRIEDDEAIALDVHGGASLAVDLSSYTVTCVTFANPPVTAEGTANSDGTFTVKIAGGKDQEFSCTIMQGSTLIATLVLEDTSTNDMGGNPQTKDSVKTDKDVNLATITIDLSTQLAKASKPSGLKDAESSGEGTLAKTFDPTGIWKFSSINDFSLPTGFNDICALGALNCKGPQVDQTVYVRRLAGKAFTPDATCASAVAGHTFNPAGVCGGTSDSTKDRYAIMVWASQTAFNTCGQKLGFNFSEGKAFGKIDLSGAGVTEGAYSWTYTQGWKNTASATSNRQVNNCAPDPAAAQTFNGKNYVPYYCKDSNNHEMWNIYQGCVLHGTTTPVQVTNWAGGTGAGCTASALSGGFYTQTCRTTGLDHDGNAGTAVVDVDCTNYLRAHNAADGAGVYVSIAANGSGALFNFSNVAIIYNNATACSAPIGGTGTVTAQMAQLQCYANYYYNSSSERQDETKCLKDLRTDWSTNDPLHFVLDNDGPARATTENVKELLQYHSADSMTFRHEGTDIRGLPGDGGGQTTCRVINRFKMDLKKVSATKMMGVMIRENVLADTGKPGCVAGATSLGIGLNKTMFYMNKQ